MLNGYWLNILNRTWLLSPEIVLILFTRGLPCVLCAKNCPTCKYYTANYRIFLEHQLNSKRFPRAISNSRRFRGLPGVVDILLLLQKFVIVRCAPSAAATFRSVEFAGRADYAAQFSEMWLVVQCPANYPYALANKQRQHWVRVRVHNI